MASDNILKNSNKYKYHSLFRVCVCVYVTTILLKSFSKLVLSFMLSSIGTQIDAEHVVSRLRILGAKIDDTGNYTCRFFNDTEDFPRGRVKVHVVDGKKDFNFIANVCMQAYKNPNQ